MYKQYKLLLLATMLASLGFAQGPTAVLVGTVTDSTGGVISSATVRVRHIETQLEQVTTTNAAGAYRIVGLQAGQHELTTSAPQFSTRVKPEFSCGWARSFAPTSCLMPAQWSRRWK